MCLSYKSDKCSQWLSIEWVLQPVMDICLDQVHLYQTWHLADSTWAVLVKYFSSHLRDDSTTPKFTKCHWHNYVVQAGTVWYGMVNVDLYSTIITKVSNALMVHSHIVADPLVTWRASSKLPLQLFQYSSNIITTSTTTWQHSVVVSGIRRMNEVNARRAQLVPGWVTVFRRVYHLGM